MASKLDNAEQLLKKANKLWVLFFLRCVFLNHRSLLSNEKIGADCSSCTPRSTPRFENPKRFA
jgi:hypothetical protein